MVFKEFLSNPLTNFQKGFRLREERIMYEAKSITRLITSFAEISKKV